MRFNSRARLDTSRVRPGGSGAGGTGGRRGGGPGGGIGLPHVAGGGVGVIVLAIIIVIIQARTGGGGLSIPSSPAGAFGGSRAADTGSYAACRTGADANSSDACALVAVENSLTDYWSAQPQVAAAFEPEREIDVFAGQTSTGGCGTADTGAGPFYCSGDQTIYLDPAFYDTVYRQLGGDATPFVRAYVIAHEYGHHIQDLLGTMSRVHTQQGRNSDSVRLELQADCYAGMWARAATTTKDADGQVLIEDLDAQDIEQALGAASTVGDDYIEKRTGGQVDPGRWTHGSSAERQAWFRAGMGAHDDIAGCDTFGASDLTDPASVA